MAKVSELSSAVAPDSDDLLYLVEDGISRKWTLGAAVAWLVANGVQGTDAELAALAGLASANNKIPRFTGAGTADMLDFSTSAALGSSDTTIPSQKAIKDYVDSVITGGATDVMVFKGVIDASANPNYPAGDAGHLYKISVAGKIGGASGPNVEAGDTVYCITDATSAGNHATVGANWVISQVNIDGQVIGPASSADSRIARFDGATGKLLKDGGTDAALIDTATHAATSKATPVDADELPLVDSAASNVLKRLTWANLKATLKTYFDTLYSANSNTVTALSISSGVVNIDCSLGDFFTLALTANVTSITFSNLPGSGKGASKGVRLQQDGTGSRTVALPASFKATAGSDTAVQSAANAYTVLMLTSFDNGTRWEYTMRAGAA
jgi:hypothetical protein